jgi:hypothetical protein
MSHLIYDAGEQLSISLQGKDTTLQEATDAADLAVCYLERLKTDVKSFIRFMRMLSNAQRISQHHLVFQDTGVHLIIKTGRGRLN